MRLFLSIVIALFVSSVFFFTIKFWGLSQHYIDYNHSFYKDVETPIIFKKPNINNFHALMRSTEPLYLNLAITADDKIVIAFPEVNFQYRRFRFADLIDQAFLLENQLEFLKNKKIIFNITENAVAGPDIIFTEFQKMQLDKAENFMISSPYEAVTKELKIKAPTWIFGTSTPEILKIKAMESLYLIESAVYRADIIVYPLKYYHHDFYSETLLTDLKRRFKRFIIGPIAEKDLPQAKALNPFGIILETGVTQN